MSILKERSLRAGGKAVLIVAGAVVLAVLANLVASQLTVRFDLTANKIYTLSPVSVEAVEGLTEPVEVIAFISSNMPVPFHNLAQDVDELLMEYQAASRGKLSYRVVSPEDEPGLDEIARGFGIGEVAIGQQSDREVSYRAVFKGVAFVQGERVERIENLQSSGRPEMDNFEYDFTRALLNLSREKPRRVVFLAGAGGPADDPEFREYLAPMFRELYGNILQVEVLDLNAVKELSEDISAAVLFDITGDFSPEALFVLDQYIQRGGNVGWFQSGSVYDQQLQRRLLEEMRAEGRIRLLPPVQKPLRSNLVEFFSVLGLDFRSDAVIDRARGLSTGMALTEYGPVQVNHPATFPITDINREVGFTRHFTTLALPVPATMTFNEAARRPGVEVIEVLRTEETSRRRPTPPVLPTFEEVNRADPSEEEGPFVVAAVLQGRLASYYEDAPLPPGRRELDLVADPQEARIFVMGSGAFLGDYDEAGYDQRLAMMGLQFFLSALEWLAEEGDLSEIRSKAMPRYIVEVPREVQRSMQFINIVMVPSLFGCIGVFMMIRRRRRREALEAEGTS